jgi:hypothetical protein
MKLLNSNQKEINQSKLLTKSAKQWAIKNWHYLTKVDTPLINVNSSSKIAKGKKINLLTGILYLKPADMISTKTLCAGADAFGCKKECLESSGQLGMRTGDNAKIKRTILFLLRERDFLEHMRAEILAHQKSAERKKQKFAVRLNGTSDIDFSNFIQSMPSTQFYDYTKIYQRVKNNTLKNYDLTFSGSANNPSVLKITARAIRAGFRTVLAMNTAETKGEYKLPNKLGLIPLVNMDDTDARFLDDLNALGVLARKGSNKDQRAKDESTNNFFFTQATINQLGELL